MSFSLIHTWGTGEIFTHAQANALAIDVTNALDKSPAGDTISGTITMVSTGVILCNQPGNIQIYGEGGCNAGTAGAIQATQPGAIQALVAGGISDGGTVGGIAATVAGGIQATVAGGITATVGGGITSGANGGIRLTGNAADWITYAAPRTVNRFQPIYSAVFAAGWSVDTPGALGPGIPGAAQSTGTSGNLLRFPLPLIHNGFLNGSTLTSVQVFISVATHSGVPTTPPTISIQRIAYPLGGSGGTVDPLFSSSFVPFWPSGAFGGIATPANGAAWTAGSNVQQITFTPDQNNVIDTTNYQYECLITDEQGLGAVTGNVYFGIFLHHNQIGNSAP